MKRANSEFIYFTPPPIQVQRQARKNRSNNMALHAFQCNPSLGGFGSESVSTISLAERSGIGENNKEYDCLRDTKDGGCDAFAQIVKELVDNAVDACSGENFNSKSAIVDRFANMSDESMLNEKVELKRVRVSIERLEHNATECTSKEMNQILRVTVSDNGSGMANIKKCVSAFCTSKAVGNTKSQSQKQISKDKAHQSQTAGRYGMGLTLCLLHAQRLVPNSCALIKSATPSAKVWTKEKFVVDTINDRIISVEEETLSKNTNESGTVCRLHVYHKC